MHNITIDNITIVCTDADKEIINKILSKYSYELKDIVNKPTNKNKTIPFTKLNQPQEYGNYICHIPELEPLTPQEADKYFQDNYGCNFNIAAWLFGGDLIYKEKNPYNNAELLGGSVWLEIGLTLEDNSDRIKLTELFSDVDYNGIFLDKDSLNETNGVMTLEQCLNLCEEWSMKYNIFEEIEEIKRIYDKYREYTGNAQNND